METGEMRIGFIGQGFIGKNYADNFEARDFEVIRYALEEPHIGNKDQIQHCDIVFIAVPTPTTPEGFDASIVKDAIGLVGTGKIAVIKSTILPGTTTQLQQEDPDRIVLYSPEFLSEATAAHDAANPFSNIVGVSVQDEAHERAARAVHAVLADAPQSFTCTSLEAELIKYSHNGSGFVSIVFFNLMYDLAQKLGASWEPIQAALQADPFIANRYAKPVHKSGRGAGGHCFIKDFAALRELYESEKMDDLGVKAFRAVEEKNISLLKESGKDLDLLEGVYGYT